MPDRLKPAVDATKNGLVAIFALDKCPTTSYKTRGEVKEASVGESVHFFAFPPLKAMRVGR
jgi:hypothetical protein